MAGDFARFEPAYGTTLEGNAICALRLGNASAPKAVMINGGLHAREWISPASMLGVIKELLTVRPPASCSSPHGFCLFATPVSHTFSAAQASASDEAEREH
jgi:hypothetical protein